MRISAEAQRVLFRDIYQRRHIEACGVLTGSIDDDGNWHIEQAHPLRNIFNSPVYFEFAPEDLLEMELSHPGQIVGVYHSHPTGMKTASSTDRKNMMQVNVEQQIPWVWLIVAGPFNSDEITAKADEEEEKREEQQDISLVAYHHYACEGLKRIRIQFVEAETEKSHLDHQIEM